MSAPLSEQVAAARRLVHSAKRERNLYRDLLLDVRLTGVELGELGERIDEALMGTASTDRKRVLR